jgi:hypothetical protein
VSDSVQDGSEYMQAALSVSIEARVEVLAAGGVLIRSLLGACGTLQSAEDMSSFL